MRLGLLGLALVACASEAPDIDTDTEPPEPTWDCEPDSREGAAGATDGILGDAWIRYSVRTPADYDPTVAHPLLMVYAPAGGDEKITESFTGLTAPATAAGWVVAYANHVSPRSVEAVAPLATIPVEIAETWCIDTDRVYLTGHSDGGTAASVIAIFGQMDFPPAGIAPSAAGISTSVVQGVECPAPLPVMVLHSRNDGLFPVANGFGRGVADWWAACNSCDATPGGPDFDGCIAWSGCAEGADVRYCEGTGSHGSWPRLNTQMIDFLGGP